jgi:hypothetical protein
MSSFATSARSPAEVAGPVRGRCRWTWRYFTRDQAIFRARRETDARSPPRSSVGPNCPTFELTGRTR